MSFREARAAALALLALTGLAVGATPGMAQEMPCRRVVERAWTEAGMEPGQATRIMVAPRGYAKDTAMAADFLVTTATPSCSGKLVVHVTGICSVRQVYTRGDCEMPGVPAFP